MREIYHQFAKDVLGTKKGQTKSKNINIETLSNYQKKLKLEVQSEHNRDKRRKLRSKRNKIMKELHKIVQKEREEKELNKIEDIERAKNDSNKGLLGQPRCESVGHPFRCAIGVALCVTVPQLLTRCQSR